MSKNGSVGEIFEKVKKLPNFSFASNTTYGCGGTAKAAFYPADENEAEELFSAFELQKEKFFVLGCGSNVLAQDGFYDGYVINTSRLDSIQLSKDGTLVCGCGLKVAALLSFCSEKGLSGLEFLAGIPATIGGLVFMNGGAGGKFISERVKSVSLYDGKKRILSREECDFTYKHSTMRDIKCIILSAEFVVLPSSGKNVKRNIEYYLNLRKNMPRGRSCGCVFKNYCGVSAGRIIEDAGLKGARVGKAFVSPKHANFIINGGTCSSDVYRLICLVKEEVYKKFGITLNEEVCFIGDFG